MAPNINKYEMLEPRLDCAICNSLVHVISIWINFCTQCTFFLGVIIFVSCHICPEKDLKMLEYICKFVPIEGGPMKFYFGRIRVNSKKSKRRDCKACIWIEVSKRFSGKNLTDVEPRWLTPEGWRLRDPSLHYATNRALTRMLATSRTWAQVTVLIVRSNNLYVLDQHGVRSDGKPKEGLKMGPFELNRLRAIWSQGIVDSKDWTDGTSWIEVEISGQNLRRRTVAWIIRGALDTLSRWISILELWMLNDMETSDY